MEISESEAYVQIAISELEENVGQLEGLPSNPRVITDTKMGLLKANIQNYPEMLKYRSLMVYPLENGHYIIVGGNMRYKAMLELGIDSVPCVVIPKETSIDKIKAYTIIDNNSFGVWDFEELADNWDEELLVDCGVDIIDKDWEDLPYVDEEQEEPNLDKAKLLTIEIPKDKEDLLEEIKQCVNAAVERYNLVAK